MSGTHATLLLLCGLLTLMPSSAASSSSEMSKNTVATDAEDFAEVDSLLEETEAEVNGQEVEDRLENWEHDMDWAFSTAQLEHDEHDEELKHADYSSALLNTAQELLKKHVKTEALDSFSTQDVEKVLQRSGALRDSVAAHMEDTGDLVTKEKHLLLERAVHALGAERGALLEQSTKRKDATPCIHVLESVNGFPLADFDGPNEGQGYGGMGGFGGGMGGFGGGMGGFGMQSAQQCQQTCLSQCKNALRMGASKFQIDRDEMSAMGMSQREISLTGGQPQVGAKCDGSRCSCLDATATKNKVMQLMHSGQGMVDLTKEEQFEGYPSELNCMMNCRDEPGIVQPFGFRATFQGVCFDEAFSFGS